MTALGLVFRWRRTGGLTSGLLVGRLLENYGGRGFSLRFCGWECEASQLEGLWRGQVRFLFGAIQHTAYNEELVTE